MKVNIQKRKRIFKGAILSLVLFAFVLTMMAPFAFATNTYTKYVCEVLATINVRSGPGLSYDVVCQYTKGTTFSAVQEDYLEADGYRWYSCPDGWIAQTGGLKFYSTVVSEEYISCYSPYGQLSWDHSCSGNGNNDWGYYLDVVEDGYWFSCDCGWKTRVTFPRKQTYDPIDGTLISDIYFQGLDTDNDELVDLYPGQSKRLDSRAGSDLRPYTLLEFYDEAIKDIPTVTFVFVDSNKDEIARYTFNFSAEMRVYDFGIEMTGNDGTYVLHELSGDYIVTDLVTNYMIADTGFIYSWNYNLKDLSGDYLFIHPERFFMIAPAGEGPNGYLENIVSDLKGIFGSGENFFGQFGGLGAVFTDEDSPVKQFFDGIGSGVASVFNCVKQFILSLPTEIVAPISVMFILAVAIGIVRLFF